jgi:hypothetical protein
MKTREKLVFLRRIGARTIFKKVHEFAEKPCALGQNRALWHFLVARDLSEMVARGYRAAYGNTGRLERRRIASRPRRPPSMRADMTRFRFPDRDLTEAYQQADQFSRLASRRIGCRPEELECPYEQSAMTPCIARDGHLAVCESVYGGLCVGCERRVSRLLEEELAKH